MTVLCPLCIPWSEAPVPATALAEKRDVTNAGRAGAYCALHDLHTLLLLTLTGVGVYGSVPDSAVWRRDQTPHPGLRAFPRSERGAFIYSKIPATGKAGEGHTLMAKHAAGPQKVHGWHMQTGTRYAHRPACQAHVGTQTLTLGWHTPLDRGPVKDLAWDPQPRLLSQRNGSVVEYKPCLHTHGKSTLRSAERHWQSGPLNRTGRGPYQGIANGAARTARQLAQPT